MNKANSKWSLITRDKAKRDRLKVEPIGNMDWMGVLERNKRESDAQVLEWRSLHMREEQHESIFGPAIF